MKPLILTLDSTLYPERWVTWERAVSYIARDKVSSVIGEHEITCIGGVSRHAGHHSVLTTNSIIVLKGRNPYAWQYHDIPFSPRIMFHRDRMTCAYCGASDRHVRLTCDHIVPMSRGGETSWMNCVTSCASCNTRKGAKLLEECGMQLLYLPYRPSRFEQLILTNRRILGDQMELLKQYLPDNSRLLVA